MSAETLRMIIVVLGVGAGLMWLSGSGVNIDPTRTLGPAIDMVGSWLKTFVERVSIAVLLVGALVFLSPQHQALGKKLAIGALISLFMAEVGPPVLHWAETVLANSVTLLFRGGV